MVSHQALDFVILELNLSKRHRAEVLHWIRHTNQFKRMPVAVLSSCPLEVMPNRFHDASLEANGYFAKPTGLSVLPQLASDLKSLLPR